MREYVRPPGEVEQELKQRDVRDQEEMEVRARERQAALRELGERVGTPAELTEVDGDGKRTPAWNAVLARESAQHHRAEAKRYEGLRDTRADYKRSNDIKAQEHHRKADEYEEEARQYETEVSGTAATDGAEPAPAEWVIKDQQELSGDVSHPDPDPYAGSYRDEANP